ncbi:hypothetical protein IV54_GL000827 [Levilactobacillus paucivorans]|uniref:Uncharacterized protein n=1 Tax=Levilactobacillus paucivorans TaxID=616990 RepID=A0A0R2LZE7_9LACO|nr:hypothetical protein [Levilactobacillus paucivorans]KRO04802.1 hypothetical protein IV54_GL000827 [Levilactobacillus paucivorans]
MDRKRDISEEKGKRKLKEETRKAMQESKSGIGETFESFSSWKDSLSKLTNSTESKE